MKKFVSMLLSAALLLGLLGACREGAPSGPSPEPALEWTAANLSEIAFQCSGFEASGEIEHLYIDHDRDRLAAYIENAYGLEGWEDAAVSRALGASSFEIAVVRMEDEDAAARAAASLMTYRSNRQGDFAGYAPAEADMAANGEILQEGLYVALFICPNPQEAGAAVKTALKGGAHSVSESEAPAAPITSVKELRDILVASQGMEGADLEKLDDGDIEALNAYLENVYGLTQDLWTEAAIARDPETAFEVAVIRASNDGDEVLSVSDDDPIVIPGGLNASSAMGEKLDNYLTSREGEFDPDSDQGQLLHRAIAGSAGEGDTWYAVLLACADKEEAIDAFIQAGGTGFSWTPRYNYLDTDSNYPDRCAFTPPNKDDMSLYDTSAIRAAWAADDPSGLSDYDRDIYDAAQTVLDQVLENNMDDLERETAIYGWIVDNVNYDWTHQDIMASTPQESFTPYGGLVNRTAVCLGYATTFQLLCDLAGVECITVVGAAFRSEEDHAWNMVQLDGNWYCVDVTWDVNQREQMGDGGYSQDYWIFFNVTSDEMAWNDHQWDYANTPEAITAGNGRG